MFGCDSAATAFASRSKRASESRVVCEVLGQHLDRRRRARAAGRARGRPLPCRRRRAARRSRRVPDAARRTGPWVLPLTGCVAGFYRCSRASARAALVEAPEAGLATGLVGGLDLAVRGAGRSPGRATPALRRAGRPATPGGTATSGSRTCRARARGQASRGSRADSSTSAGHHEVPHEQAAPGEPVGREAQQADLPVHLDERLPRDLRVVFGARVALGRLRAPELEVGHVDVDDAVEKRERLAAVVAARVVDERQPQALLGGQLPGPRAAAGRRASA